MIKYQIRSRELLDLIKDVRDKRLIISPYFQRDLVWRELHKVDFIRTIRMGYPFPQIFISRGKVNVDTMTSQACVVDGQQRMNAILEFLSGDLKVDGKYFSDLSSIEKEHFLKYEVPVIDLDLAEGDPEIIAVFTRLNRTFYSLSKIEKLATEYAPSEFMFVAKLLSNQVNLATESEEPLKKDPNVPEDLYLWSAKQKVKHFQNWLANTNIFSSYESSRKVPLMFTLNLMSTYIGGFFNRNQLTETYLEALKEDFDDKNALIKDFEKIAKFILDLDLPENSYWYNKSNAFSLFMGLSTNVKKLSSINKLNLRKRLIDFENNIPKDYSLSAKEAVNNLKERGLRHDYVLTLINNK